MYLTKTIKTIALTIVLALVSLPAASQDLLARTAPVDKKMKSLDTLALHEVVERENMETPSSDLYSDWDNRYAHKATELPDTYKINLRGFCMPTPSRVITSQFGPRWGRQHRGLDIKVYIGDTIRAAFAGKVRVVKYEAKGYGNYVVTRHNNGLETIYGHMSKHLVKENQVVKAGTPIGLGGNTGRSTGSHLHFETRLCGVALNPALFFDFRNQDVTGDYYIFHRSQMESESAKATAARGLKQNSYTKDDVYGGKKSSEPTSSTANRQESERPTPSASNARYHRVVADDTVHSIARQHNVSVDRILRLNSFINPNDLVIKPGQAIRY